MPLQLLVVTPEKKVVEADADEVELPGAEGYLGILPGHTPLITLLKTGVLTFRKAGRSQAFAVSAGLAEIANDLVHVLANSAEGQGEIDVASAERARAGAEEEMKTASAETLPGILARFELADARIHAAKRPA